MKSFSRFSRKLKKQLNEFSEMPEELTMRLPKIVILADEECLIENCQGIIEYENDKIRLKTKIGDICIIGKNLHINEMGEGELLIKGKVNSVLIEGED